MPGLTRSITDRVFVGLLSTTFAPFAAFILYARLTRPSPAVEMDWLAQLFVFLVFECITVLFLGSVLGIVWAIWTPEWLERRLKHSVSHFVILVCATCIVISAGALIYTFVQKP